MWIDPCKYCNAALESDTEGFIQFRKPVGIPDEVIPTLALLINAQLIAVANMYHQDTEEDK